MGGLIKTKLMWYRLGQNILKYKKTYLFFILLSTVVMGYFAVQIKLSYEYTKAIPSDNPKFIVYNEFVKKYGVDGTTVVVGFKTDQFYTKDFFNQVDALHKTIKQNTAVAKVMSIPNLFLNNLTKIGEISGSELTETPQISPKIPQ